MQGVSLPDRELLDTAALCGHLVPAGSVYALLSEHRKRIFPDELFADLFESERGRPSIPTDVIAVAMVLKELEGLSDRPHRIDEAVKDVARQTGILNGRSRRALDSTVLDDAVATQDTVTQLVAAIRKVRKLVPAARQVVVAAHDYDKAGKPDCAWDDQAARDALVTGLVEDALAIIDALPVVGLDDDQERAVALLALVAGQDVEPGETPGSWRIARAVAKDRVVSTVDLESRHAHKSTSSYRDGLKGHIATEPESGLITSNTLTAGNTGDGEVAVQLLADEPEPVEALGDSAYGGGQTRHDLGEAGHSTVIKPLPLVPAVPGGLDRDDFRVDHAAGTVTCPNNHTVTISAKGNASFGRRCQGCRCEGGARPTSPGAACASASTTHCWSPPARKPKRPSSPRRTRAGRSRSARSPGGRQGRASTLPLPRDQTQPAVVEPPRRRGQPDPPDGPRAALRRRLEGLRDRLSPAQPVAPGLDWPFPPHAAPRPP